MKVNVLIKSMKETQYKYGKEVVKLDVKFIQYLRQAGYEIFVSQEPQVLIKPSYTNLDGVTMIDYDKLYPNVAYVWYLDDMPYFRDGKEI